MKKTIILLLTLVVFSILQYFILGSCYIESNLINNVVVFLSIIFGFYITSLAIFVTSTYVSQLYKITDQNNKSVTLLHTLISEYKVGLILILISILYLLIIEFVLRQTDNNKIILSAIYALPFSWVVITNFFYSYRMLDTLIKVIIQEAKNK
jgi:hypothetical protein